MLKQLWRRFHSDYLLPGRWEEYRAFLGEAKKQGYQFVCHREAPAKLAAVDRPLLFLRHDVDTDVPIARKLFRMERELGIRSTYYFRRSTADAALMREIAEGGSEVGYHYEEVADYIKEKGLKSAEEAMASMGAIRDRFLGNLRQMEAALGRKIDTIAAHGDWVNRKLGLPNQVLLDASLRAEAGLILEAYDEFLNSQVDFRTSDRLGHPYWKPGEPQEALRRRLPVVLVLIHPRSWQRAPVSRFKADLLRIREGLRYRFG